MSGARPEQPWRVARRPVGAALGLWLALAAGTGCAAINIDSGVPADLLVPVIEAGARDGWSGGWVRLRDMSGLPAPTAAGDARFQALAALRARGVKPLVFFAPGTSLWLHGVRDTEGVRAYPLDLGEAYVQAERLAFDAWPNVAAWEIGNEPDLFWTRDNAATYASYLKAVALGLRAGSRAAAQAARSAPRDPVILNGALAMTPGPYLEQLAANDVFSHLDGFNWHFYGYPEDFTDQYRQFEHAVTTLAAARVRPQARAGPPPEKKTLPVFLTEYGYAGLDGPAAATKAGRVRQWRWFRDVTGQMQALRIAGPLAFYLPPYLEAGRYEFGLTMRRNGLQFTPADFGLAKPEPWMRLIGAPVGENVASPAFAWLAAQPAPRRSRDWPVTVAPPSPVVIDFVPTDELAISKSWHGYQMKSGGGNVLTGGGELRIYNFSDQTLTGRLTTTAPRELETRLITTEAGQLTLAPFALASVPVRLWLTADRLRSFAWEVSFHEQGGRVAPAVFATQFLPNAEVMRKETMTRFDHPPEAAAENRRRLLTRPLAGDEPKLLPNGRWLVSDGVTVEETADGWSFRVEASGTPALSCARAELPLPDGWGFPAAHVLQFDCRTAAAPATGSGGMEWDCLFRSTSGNLFEVLPRLTATAAWTRYAQAKENFTGMSYGRMQLPWRFGDNQPAALVFFLRPKTLPAVFEVRNVEIARYVARQQ